MSEMLFFVITTIVKAVVILAVMASLAGLATYAERKVLAYMQRRVGLIWRDLLACFRSWLT